MSLLISVICYNQPEITRQCVEALQAYTEGDFDIHLWDNGSNRETREMIYARRALEIDYVYHSPRNQGFIYPNNQLFGMAQAQEYDYFCCVNNDLVIYEPGWNFKLIDAMEANGWSAAGARQKFQLGPDMLGVPRTRPELDYVDGSLLMVKVKDLEFLPTLFDEKYLRFIYFEDSDLSLRLQARGLKIGEVDLKIDHRHNLTCGKEKIRVDLERVKNENMAVMRDRWTIARTEKRPMRILVKRSHATGDVLCTEPILRELFYKYPGAEISVETLNKDILAFCGLPIKEIGPELESRGGWDKIINLWLSYEAQPLMHMVDAYARTAQVVLKPHEKIPRYDPGLRWSGKKTWRILVNSQGSWPSRTWNLSRWRDVLNEIKSDRYEIVEIGTGCYVGVGENMIGKHNNRDGLHEIAKMMTESDYYLGFDGLLMHIAQSVGLPSLIVFGSTYPGFRVHDWSSMKAVWLDQEKIPCAGCHHRKPGPQVFTECPGNIDCLDQITVQDVLDVFYNSDFGNKPEFYNLPYAGYMKGGF